MCPPNRCFVNLSSSIGLRYHLPCTLFVFPPSLSLLFLPPSLPPSLSVSFIPPSLPLCLFYSSLPPLQPLSAQGTDKDRDYRSGGRSYVDGTSEVANGLEGPRNWQGKFYDIDEKYKDSMVANAQLYNDKTALVYQVEELKDR